MRPLRIYLADLTHTGNGVATEGIPLNIGLIASHALARFGADISISLFKFPMALEERLRDTPPDILGCSNYVWNSNLSYHFIRLAKLLEPTSLTVFGGTNYPFDAASQEKFLRARPELDMHIFYEGEHAFANILERRLGADARAAIFGAPIDGVQFLAPGSRAFVTGAALPRIKVLDAIRSPYTSGLMDQFFDGILTPLVETARGCPFRCNFCNAGDAYFNKVNLFSDDYVKEELTYIARKASEVGTRHLTLLDNNFGMVPRDARTAEVLYDLQTRYGWPKSVSAWTGKNSKERVIDVTRLLGDTLSISMSVQSMDSQVLLNIKRDNIKLDHYRKIADDLNAQGRPQHAEVIMPLPGETMASHIAGLNALLDTNVSRVLSHTLQMLHGTPYKDDPDYLQRHGYVSKWRVVPLDFSRIGSQPIFDVEEVGVATNTLSFADYVRARTYLLVLDLAYNSGVFEPLKKWLRQRGIANSTWIERLFDGREAFDPQVNTIFDSFEAETQSELWDTEADLVAFYSQPENYRKLVDYEMGGNVLFKHRVWVLSRAGRAWVETVFRLTEPLVLETAASDDERRLVQRELGALELYNLATVSGWASGQAVREPLFQSFDYDVPRYLTSPADAALADCAVPKPLRFEFSFSGHAIEVMEDGFRRYGTDLAGLVKLLQRVPSISFALGVKYDGGLAPVAVAKPTRQQHGPGYSAL